MKKKRNKKTVIIIVFLLIIVAISTFFIVKRNKEISASEKIVASNYTIQSITTFNRQMDSITSLYLAGYISKEDYLNHLTEFEKELVTIKAEYNALPEVNINTKTEQTEKGEKAVEKIIELNTENLGYKQEHSGDKKAILKEQLTYKDKVIKQMKEFENSNKIAQEEIGKERVEEIQNGNL